MCSHKCADKPIAKEQLQRTWIDTLPGKQGDDDDDGNNNISRICDSCIAYKHLALLVIQTSDS